MFWVQQAKLKNKICSAALPLARTLVHQHYNTNVLWKDLNGLIIHNMSEPDTSPYGETCLTCPLGTTIGALAPYWFLFFVFLIKTHFAKKKRR